MSASSSSDDLIGQASRLSAHQIAELARMTREAMGTGLWVYLGLRSTPLTANALMAVRGAGGEEAMRAKVSLADEAVLTAAIGAAQRMGYETSGVGEAWQRYQRTVEGENRRRKHVLHSTQRAFRKGLGSHLTSQWPMASIGVSWALMAFATWHLATPGGPYTLDDRELLARPWMAVSTFPMS
jgi:hypothetical protein